MTAARPVRTKTDPKEAARVALGCVGAAIVWAANGDTPDTEAKVRHALDCLGAKVSHSDPNPDPNWFHIRRCLGGAVLDLNDAMGIGGAKAKRGAVKHLRMAYRELTKGGR